MSEAEDSFLSLKGVQPNEVKLKKHMTSGGISELWLASHPRTKNPFLVKYSQYTASENPYVYGQFEREYESSLALRDNNLSHCSTRIADFDVDSLEHPYLYIEYFPSLPLDLLMPKIVQWLDVKNILQKLCKILGAIHAAGIVHRDVKPSNVVIDKTGEVKLIDFALATIDGRWHRFHEESTAIGTPLYMSPEQAYGKRIMLTSASDWYAVGVMLYEWMTGTHPFKGESANETMRMHCFEQAPLPKNSRIFNAPEDLALVCQRLLNKEPNARFSAVRTLRKLLLD